MSQREILFKAKRADNGNWIQGNLIVNETTGQHMIMHVWPEHPDLYDFRTVIPETVCQYTGLTDKNGKKIFEEDILRIAKKSDGIWGYYFPPLEYPVNVSVKFDLCAYMWETIGEEKYYISFPDAWCHYQCEVIGNINDN